MQLPQQSTKRNLNFKKPRRLGGLKAKPKTMLRRPKGPLQPKTRLA